MEKNKDFDFSFLEIAKFSGISFKTESGHLILISPEDCKIIANKIISEGLCDTKGDRVRLVVKKDEAMDKIRLAYDILQKEEKKMTDETRASYHLEILNLIKERLPLVEVDANEDFKTKQQ